MAIHRENLYVIHGKIKDMIFPCIILPLLYLLSIIVHLWEEMGLKEFILFMFNYELRQRKDMKVSASTLEILFNLIWNSFVSHSLDAKADSLGMRQGHQRRDIKPSSPITLLPYILFVLHFEK